MKTKLRLFARDRFGTLTIECKKCKRDIIKDGVPMRLTYYKENKTDDCFCPKCKNT